MKKGISKKETKEKKINKPKKVKKPKENFLKSVRNEMKLVKWPTWKEVFKNTMATIVLVLIIVVFFIALNLLLALVKGWVA